MARTPRPTKEMVPIADSARAVENKSSEMSAPESAPKRRMGRPKGEPVYSLDLNKENKKSGNTTTTVRAESKGTPKDTNTKRPASRQIDFAPKAALPNVDQSIKQKNETSKSLKESTEGPKHQQIHLNEKMEVLFVDMKVSHLLSNRYLVRDYLEYMIR